MTPTQRNRLDESRIGQPVRFKDKHTGKLELWGKVDDEVFIIVGGDYGYLPLTRPSRFAR